MKKLLLIVGTVVVLALITLAILPHFINANSFKPRVQAQLTKALGRPVTIGDLSVSFFAGGITADSITIADDPAFAEQPFIEAKSVKIGVDMSALLFSHKLKIRSLTLESPQIRLLQDQAGHWNYASLGGAQNTSTGKPGSGSSAGDELSAEKVAVEDGAVTIGRLGGTMRSYSDVQLMASDLSYTAAFPFHFTAKTPGNGSLDLDGKTGPINQQDASATPLNAKVIVKNLNIGDAGFTDPKSGVAGTADFTGTVDSNGLEVQIQGDANIANGKFVPAGHASAISIGFHFDATYTIASEMAEIKSATVTIGKASAQLTGTLDNQPASPVLDLKFSGSGMPVDALEDVLPAFGAVLPASVKLQRGTAGVNVTLTGPLDNTTATGSVALNNVVLENFDLGSKMKGIGALAGIPSSRNTEIQSLNTSLKHNNRTGSELSNLYMVIPTIGNIAGQGTITPGNELDFHLLVKLTHNSAAGFLTEVTGAGGSKGVPVNVRGTMQNPQFSPDMGGIAKNMNPVTRVGKPATGLVHGLFGKKQNK